LLSTDYRERVYAGWLGKCIGVRLAVTAVGAELAVAMDVQQLLRWRDEDMPYLSGQIGLGNGPAYHTRFERIVVQGID
jgi:hypothetical protein